MAILYQACGSPSQNNNRNLGQKEKEMYNILIQGDKEMLPVVQIDQLLNSEVFKGELESMSGAFYTILFKWLNIAFEVYDDKSKEREREFVKDLAMNVLNHEELLHDIWQQIDRRETPMLFE